MIMGWYRPSRPRRVRNGIRARSRHGKIGSTWWSERWLSTLASFEWASRLERGRSYARMGQVMEFKLSSGQVDARVQGSRPKPYRVSIKVRPLTDKQWDRALEAIGSQALFAAKLLAGEMPHDIEDAFNSSGLSLFPSKKEIQTACSCPDYANPCKHTAAVYYILAEEFDRDPFMIFYLRGMSKERIIERLRRRWASQVEGDASGSVRFSRMVKHEGGGEPQPLEESVRAFWTVRKPLDQFYVSVAEPRVVAAIIKRLGEPPSWRETEDFVKLMESLYQVVTRRALETAFKSATATE